jgi:hypothetical protein
MIFNIFKQLANVTGLPLIVSLFALVIILTLTLFGILILTKVGNIKKVLNNLNNRLDILSQKLGRQSGESENIQSYEYELGSHINNEITADGRTRIKSNNIADIALKNGFEEHRMNTEISTKIHELLKKSAKPTSYHDLTKHLSEDYPGYDYDFFLKEVEDLQKEGKVEVQLIAGKLYFQIKKT